MSVVIHDGENHAELMRWGLIPFWAKDIRISNKMINARVEDIKSKPAFRKPLESERYLISADYFFEWLQQNSKK